MKKIRPRRKHFRINSPMSFGILCAALLILAGGGVYALATGLVVPAVDKVIAANATPSPTPEQTPVLITPAPTAEEPPDEEITTTTDPITGEIVELDPEALAEGTPEPTAAPLPLAGRTVVVDAGKSKGGTHRGVSSRTYEYTINLAFAQALQQELVGLGATVIMTRENNDEVVGAAARIRVINGSNADIAVSLFCNDLSTNETRGAEAFVPQGSGQAEACKKLASAILTGYTNATGMPVRETDGGVIRTVTNKEVLSGSEIPVMGLVLGQLSNRSDDSNLNDAAFIAKAAKGIANGVRSYFGA